MELDGTPVPAAVRTLDAYQVRVEYTVPTNIAEGHHTVAINARDGLGNSSRHGSVTFAIAPAPIVTAEAISNTTVNLTWTYGESGYTGFDIQRRLETFGEWALVATVSAGATSWQATTLSPDTGYDYRVRATGGTAGTSPWSAVVTAKTTDAPLCNLSSRPDNDRDPIAGSRWCLDGGADRSRRGGVVESTGVRL